MGQPSIPSLNKSGESMYWSSMWDQKNNFESALTDCLFLKELIPYFFQNFSEKRITSYLNKIDFLEKKKLILFKYNIQISQKFNFNEITVKMNNKYKKMFFSQVWIIKFQNWIFIYFFVYCPFLKKKTNTFKKKNKYYFLNNMVNKYINSIMYVKYKKKKHII